MMRFSVNCQALPLVLGSVLQAELPKAILFAIGKSTGEINVIQISSLNSKKVLLY